MIAVVFGRISGCRFAGLQVLQVPSRFSSLVRLTILRYLEGLGELAVGLALPPLVLLTRLHRLS